MHHIAIMDKSLSVIPKILSGVKTIESRWYKRKVLPWGKIKAGDKVFFKNAGEPVIAAAGVHGVLQFELNGAPGVFEILRKYGKRICMTAGDFRKENKKPNYCVLIFLKEPRRIKPFNINKKGFGFGSAWLTVKNINSIKLKDKKKRP